MNLRKILYLIQNGDNEFLLNLILEFDPIILNISRSLNYPEAQTDLIIFLIELSRKFNIEDYNSKTIKFIFIRALKNKKIDLFRKNILRNEECYEINLDIIPDNLNNFESNVFIKSLISNLPEKQKKIIIESFIKNNSDIEIANELGISRQAVNKTKKRALKNLRNILDKE